MFWSLPTRSFLVLLLLGSLAVTAQESPESSTGSAEVPVADDGGEAADNEPDTDVPDTDVPAAAPLAPVPMPSKDSGAPGQLPEGFHEELARRVDAFTASRQKLEIALGDQREIYVRYVNDDDRSKAAKDAFYQQRQVVRELLDQTFVDALDVVRIGMDEEAATFLVTLVQHRFERDIYDPVTMEAATRLIDGGSRFTFLFKTAARSAIVSGHFDMAKQLLEAMDEEQMEDLDLALLFNLDDYRSLYEAERTIREKETAEDRLPRVAMRTTQGDVVIELFLDQAPSTVAHFIGLVEQGFYDGLDFHQVIDHLLALTGDPSGVGDGNCGKYLIDEHQREDARNAFRGSLAMAKLPMDDEGRFVPNSASSQFAILFLPIVTLSEQQTVFGRVIEGMDVISRLRRVDPNKEKGKGEIVMPPDRIIEMTVIRRPETLPEPRYLDLSQQ